MAAEADGDELLRAAVAAALDTAHQAWPTLAVDEDVFTSALLSRVATDEDPPAAIARLAVGDVYFVLACAAGDRAALDQFEKRFVPDLRTALRGAGIAPAAIDETLQQLRTTLFVPVPSPEPIDGGTDAPVEPRAPRILGFAGRGHLRGWLQVTATRMAFRLARSEKRELALDESLQEAPGDLELTFLRKKYGQAFREAFQEALAELPVSDRLLLKQRFALHTTVTDLGALHGVHASTISRWVTDARGRLVAGTRAAMMRRLRLGGPEVSSILRLIHSEIDISLSTYQGSRPA